MINQIKHNSPNSVLSQFNPIASLKPHIRKKVNEDFILPILKAFFAHPKWGGIDNFSELDPDKLITEIEFKQTKNFVKTYIYKEIINEISKPIPNNKIKFKPKYVITFDIELADYGEENNIKYGVIRLGEAPVLYYIYIDLQQLIKFIKNLPEEVEVEEENKIVETEEEKRNKLLDTVIVEKQKQLRCATVAQKAEIEQEINRLEQVRQIVLEGQSGKLRINLAWKTTDDLDLHIITPKGEIAYNNKIVENEGIIGQLDVDKNAGVDIVSNPQENINFSAMPSGEHTIYVHFYRKREFNEVPFIVTIIPENGEGQLIDSVVAGEGNQVKIKTFSYNGSELIFI